MRIQRIAGYRVEQHDSPNGGGRKSGHRGVTLHHAEGTYRGTINWQMNPNQEYQNGQSVNTCSTWIVGKVTGEVAQMKDTDFIAWCERDGSRYWSSIELAGYASEVPTPWQILASAHILVAMHRAHGIPIAIAHNDGERGLGHHSMDREWLGTEWGHEACPGARTIAVKGAIVSAAREILNPPPPVTVPPAPSPPRRPLPVAVRYNQMWSPTP